MSSKENKMPKGTWRHASIFDTLKKMLKKDGEEEE